MKDRWNKTAEAIGLPAPACDAIYVCIDALYAHPPRSYHNLNHIAAMLAEFEAVRKSVESAMLVESAIWFHDCVYVPAARDNEARSADVADLLLRSSLNEAERDVLRSLILASRHDGSASTPDEKLFTDLDLAILGAEAGAYDAYARAIRQEYAEIDAARYAEGRANVIRGFLGRTAIYATPHFVEKLESRARANLRRELARLSL